MKKRTNAVQDDIKVAIRKPSGIAALPAETDSTKRVIATGRKNDEKQAALTKDGTNLPSVRPPTPPLSPDQMKDKCLAIRKSAGEGKDGNTEINLAAKEQVLKGAKYPFGDMLVKTKDSTTQKSVSFCIKSTDDTKTAVFVGGEDNNKRAFAIAGAEGGKTNIHEMAEFHSLAFSKPPATNGEKGIMTSFRDGRMAVGVIAGNPNLDSVKSLFSLETSAENNEQLKITDGQTGD